MQTLISVFDDRQRARRAVDRLVQAGIAPEDIHVRQSARGLGPTPRRDVATPDEKAAAEMTMASAEREIAVDRSALEAMGHFFVSIFGVDPDPIFARRYSNAVTRGHSVVFVDAQDDPHAEAAAVILHDCGAIAVDDHTEHTRTSDERVARIRREGEPPLREIVGGTQVLESPPH